MSPRSSLPALVLAVTLSLLNATSRDAAAQRKFATVDSLRHIQSVEPRTGPPGTVVEVYTENLPAGQDPCGGGRHAGRLRSLGRGYAGDVGRGFGDGTDPDYATWERPLVFIVFNGIFSPIGISDPFHVTNEEGLVRRTGPNYRRRPRVRHAA